MFDHTLFVPQLKCWSSILASFPKARLKRLAAASRPVLLSAFYLASAAARSAEGRPPSHLICSGEEWSSMSGSKQCSSKVGGNRREYVLQQLNKKTCMIVFFFLLINFCFLFPSREMWIICPASNVCFSASTISLRKWKLPVCHLLITWLFGFWCFKGGLWVPWKILLSCKLFSLKMVGP